MASVGRQLEFRILGPLEVLAGGRTVSLGGQKPSALVALLLLHAGEIVSADRLIEDLWSGAPPATASTSLQVYVSRLRKVLEPEREKGAEGSVLVSRPPGYALVLEDGSLDLQCFERLARAGREALAAGHDADAASRLGEALGLWRGPTLAEFAYEQWAQTEIARIEELRLACLEDRVDADLACGRHAQLVAELEAVVGANPLRERLRGQLMLALYRSGRQAEALDVFQQGRERLVEELGIDPSPELQELHRAILNQEAVLAAPTRAGEGRRAPSALPTAANPLVGRERELAEVGALLTSQDLRLLTMTGPGGVGKTRLALSVAAAAADAFPDGVVWIGLQAVRDPDLVEPTIAQALETEGDVADAIGSRGLLLCLDNFEQVVPAGPGLARLLAACPNARLLVTSRELLHVSGEHEYPLAPLARDGAAALFEARARAVQPDFATNGEVEAICRRLDNLPLALELAAARVKALTAEQILARLEHHLPVLGAGPRDAPERQRTLTAAISWSYDLLDQREQELFRRVAVFAGGCTLDAAEEVAGADLDGVQSLLDKSLLRRSGDRYWMLETIREYAQDLLEASDEAETTRSTHVDWCLALARSGDEPTTIERIARERDNLRAALTWALEADRAELALELTVELVEFWEIRGPLAEGRGWLERSLAAAQGTPRELRARALHEATSLAARQGDHEAMAGLAESQLELARSIGDPREIVRALVMLATVAGYRGDEAQALERSDEAIAIATAAEEPRSLLTALNCRGVLELARDEHVVAGELFERCLELARVAGGRRDSVATASFNVAFAALLAGDREKAVERLDESLGIYRELGHVDGIGYCFVARAALDAQAGDLVEAARALSVAGALLEEVGAALEPAERALYERTLEQARGGLDDDVFADAWTEGASLAEVELAQGTSQA